MNDAHKRIEAMYRLEICFETDGDGKQKSREEIEAHMWAAHYLVASMLGNERPSNYDEVLARSIEFDSKDAAKEAIYLAKKLA